MPSDTRSHERCIATSCTIAPTNKCPQCLSDLLIVVGFECPPRLNPSYTRSSTENKNVFGCGCKNNNSIGKQMKSTFSEQIFTDYIYFS